MIRNRAVARCVAAAALLALAACGKKGPPLAPLHLAPARVEDVKAVRRGSEVELRFTLPNTNANGPGPIDLHRVEVYAVTIAPGASAPPIRELLTKSHLVGTVPVEPLPEEGGPATANEQDTRPAPGEPVVFVETLTEDKLKAAPVKLPPPKPGQRVPEPLPFLKRAGEEHPTRVYGVRGATRSGRPGAPSAPVSVPLADPPPPAAGVKVSYTEQSMTVTWEAPAPAPVQEDAELAEWMFLVPQFPYLFYRPPPPATTFNVYLAGEAAPLNPAPLANAEFVRPGLEFGRQQCFVVRTVRTSGAVAIEGAASEPACVRPVDTFAPAAPQGLQVVSGSGDINLSWDANAEPDLAGYIVLRGEAAGETLQAITPKPITETRYRDTAVSQGVRYVYAVVAVDKATPPNTSAQSARVDETAR